MIYNRNRAALAIVQGINNGVNEYVGRTANSIAEALDEAGLLMPDLPRPFTDKFRDKHWLTAHTTTAFEGTEIEHEYTTRVCTYHNEPVLEVTTGLADYTMTVDQARSVATALLAAANYAERNKDDQ